MILRTRVIAHFQHFHLQTKETGYSMLTEHARAHFDESVLLFHTIMKRVLLNIEG